MTIAPICGIPFQLPTKYLSGMHMLTAGEASALNTLLVDNLRRVLAPELRPLVAEGTVQALLAAQRRVEAYFRRYEFSSSSRQTLPLEAEVRKLAPEGLVDFWKTLAAPCGARVLAEALGNLAVRRKAGARLAPAAPSRSAV
jgi:hypothetical protein